MLHRLLRADRQIAHQNLGARCAQRRGDIGRLEIGGTEGDIVGIIGHVRRHPVEHRTGLNDDIRHRQGALKDAGAVWLGEDRLLQRVTDLAPVYVKRRDKLDVATAIAADGLAHDAVERRAVAVAIVFHALHQRTGAIADAGDGYFDILLHAVSVSSQCPAHLSATRNPPQPTRLDLSAEPMSLMGEAIYRHIFVAVH